MNFTQLAQHYASTHKPEVTRAVATQNKRVSTGFLQKTLDKYEQVMRGKGWFHTDRLARLVGTDKYSANLILKRMRAAGIVELDDSGKNERGRPLYRWQWIDQRG